MLIVHEPCHGLFAQASRTDTARSLLLHGHNHLKDQSFKAPLHALYHRAIGWKCLAYSGSIYMCFILLDLSYIPNVLSMHALVSSA